MTQCVEQSDSPTNITPNLLLHHLVGAMVVCGGCDTISHLCPNCGFRILCLTEYHGLDFPSSIPTHPYIFPNPPTASSFLLHRMRSPIQWSPHIRFRPSLWPPYSLPCTLWGGVGWLEWGQTGGSKKSVEWYGTCGDHPPNPKRKRGER